MLTTRPSLNVGPYVHPWAIQWYRSLDVHQRIAMKDHFNDLCGVGFVGARVLFSLKEIITLFYLKLVDEGVIENKPRLLDNDRP